jgi:PAS domain S-box-containing protein
VDAALASSPGRARREPAASGSARRHGRRIDMLGAGTFRPARGAAGRHGQEIGLRAGDRATRPVAGASLLVQACLAGVVPLLLLSVVLSAYFLHQQLPEGQGEQGIGTFVRQGVAVTLLAAAVVAVLLVVLTRHVVRPLRELSRSAAQVAAGDLSVVLPEGGAKEIAALTGSFRRMVDALVVSRAQVEDHRRNLEQKVVERTRELNESEKKFRGLVQNAPDIIVKQDRSSRYLFLNEAVRALTGYPPEVFYEWPGGLAELVHPDERPRLLAAIARVLDGRAETVETRPYRFRHRDRTDRWFVQTIYPWRNEVGRILGVQGIVRDVTTRVLAEEALKKAQEDLMLSTRLAAVGEMSGSVAHEVLNPLTSVLGRCEVMIREVEREAASDAGALGAIVRGWGEARAGGGAEGLLRDLTREVPGAPGRTILDDDLEVLRALADDLKAEREGRRQHLEFMITNLLRITRIVEELRGLSRSARSIERISVVRPLSDAVAIVADAFEKRAIRLDVQAPEDLPDVNVDPSELVQVFTNILKNAMQAVEGAAAKGSGLVSVSVQAGGKGLQVRITDNGGGIRPDALARVFEAGFTTKPSRLGTGLGLSISRRLVRNHGGDVRVEWTAPSQGTTFLVTLPPAGVATAAPPSPSPNDSPAERPEPAGAFTG